MSGRGPCPGSCVGQGAAARNIYHVPEGTFTLAVLDPTHPHPFPLQAPPALSSKQTQEVGPRDTPSPCLHVPHTHTTAPAASGPLHCFLCLPCSPLGPRVIPSLASYRSAHKITFPGRPSLTILFKNRTPATSAPASPCPSACSELGHPISTQLSKGKGFGLLFPLLCPEHPDLFAHLVPADCTCLCRCRAHPHLGSLTGPGGSEMGSLHFSTGATRL